jgi:hypothetical protein
MDAAQRQLSDQIDHATQRLLCAARAIAEPDLRVVAAAALVYGSSTRRRSRPPNC